MIEVKENKNVVEYGLKMQEITFVKPMKIIFTKKIQNGFSNLSLVGSNLERVLIR